MHIMEKVEFSDLMISGCQSVKHYPYRTAMVTDRIFTVDRNDPAAHAFEKWLAERAGVDTDNHTAYALEMKSGKILYIGCSDFCISFGLSIDEVRW